MQSNDTLNQHRYCSSNKDSPSPEGEKLSARTLVNWAPDKGGPYFYWAEQCNYYLR